MQVARLQSSSQAFSSKQGRKNLRTGRVAERAVFVCHASADKSDLQLSRRDALFGSAAVAIGSLIASGAAVAGGLAEPPVPPKRLCDADCMAALDSKELVTLPSGLQYKDIIVGKGPNPPVGFQVVVNYDAMTPKGFVFDSSVEKGKPYDIRVGSGQVIPGLDEGVRTMQPGGLRRLYIPGDMAFPKGLRAAAGRPSVPPNSPVVFDVQLLYIPGLEDDE